MNALTEVVKETLQRGGDVAITGFGKFSVAERGARQGVNPQTGEKIQIAASKAPCPDSPEVIEVNASGSAAAMPAMWKTKARCPTWCATVHPGAGVGSSISTATLLPLTVTCFTRPSCTTSLATSYGCTFFSASLTLASFSASAMPTS